MNAALPLQNLKPHKLTVDDLLTLERGGAFAGLPRMELLDGTLYEMSPQTSPHVVAKNRLTFRLQCKILERGLACEALSEATVSLNANYAPEPDIIISSTPIVDGYYPVSALMLVAELAVTSLQTDMKYKKSLYAAAGVPEYWMVDVEAEQIIQFWSAEREDYLETRTVSFGDTIECATIPGLQVETSGLI
jgi:Uma2 family endonuclease